MPLNRKDLEAAVQAKIITAKQADDIWHHWEKTHADSPQFHFTHVLYYFGGLLAISAITLFVTRAWDDLVGLPLFFLSAFLFMFGLGFTHYFKNKKLRIPAGIMATFSLALVPLAIYNIQAWLGYSPLQPYEYADFHYWVSWYWVPMELSTILAGAIMFYYYRFPFLIFPIAVVLWYMSMDLFPLFFHIKDYFGEYRAIFSMYFGLVILALAIYVDLRSGDDKHDYAFWLYIFGAMAFWGGLTGQSSNSEWSKFAYCMINVVMIFTSVFLDRRIFAVFGTIGVLLYLGHLATQIFPDSLSFPLMLVTLGIVIILFATTWNRTRKKLLFYFRPMIPEKILNRMR